MAEIPKYIDELLERRKRLANKLAYTCKAIDDYCEKIGIDIEIDDSTCLNSHILIYTEPSNAYDITRKAIQEKLDETDS